MCIRAAALLGRRRKHLLRHAGHQGAILEKTRPWVRPRESCNEPLEASNSSQSSARNGRWNQMAWSRLTGRQAPGGGTLRACSAAAPTPGRCQTHRPVRQRGVPARTEVLQHPEPATRFLEALRPIEVPAEPVGVHVPASHVNGHIRDPSGVRRSVGSPATNLISNTGLQLTSHPSAGRPRRAAEPAGRPWSGRPLPGTRPTCSIWRPSTGGLRPGQRRRCGRPASARLRNGRVLRGPPPSGSRRGVSAG